MKLTYGEISYILGLKKNKFNWMTDWMFEGTLEENCSGYGYHLTIYLIKPIYYIIRPILTPFFFIYLVLEEGVGEAKEDLKRECGRDFCHLYLHKFESTSEQYERAKFIKQQKEKIK